MARIPTDAPARPGVSDDDPDPALEVAEATPLFGPDDHAVFTSRTANLRIVRIPEDDRVTNFGRQKIPGIRYEFQGGYLRINDAFKREEARQMTEVKKRFTDEELEFVDLRPAEEWLRDHQDFNDRFVELDRQVHVPDPAELLAKISELAGAGDQPALEKLFEEETETYQRDAVLDSIAHAVKGIQERQAA